MAWTMHAVLASALVLLSATSCCLTDNGSDDDGGGDLPHEGTTEGFLLPGFTFTPAGGQPMTPMSRATDLVFLHIFSPSLTDEEIVLQMTHFGPVRAWAPNATKGFYSVASTPDANPARLEGLRDSHSIDHVGRPAVDLEALLSLTRDTTLFILDGGGVIALRSDGQIGQGAMVRAVEEHWGVDPPSGVGPGVNQTAPDLLWVDIDGEVGWLGDYRDHVVLVNAFEYECPFCLLLMGELRQVRENVTDRRFHIVSIDMNPSDGEAQVRAVIEEYDATWTFAIDSDGIQSRYDIWREPALFLVDGDGVIRWHSEGLVDSSVITGEVEKLI